MTKYIILPEGREKFSTTLLAAFCLWDGATGRMCKFSCSCFGYRRRDESFMGAKTKGEKEQADIAGHLAAIFTITIWGITFISTKVLLRAFTPIEILFIRFCLGYLALWLACPKILKVGNRKKEWMFAAAGLCGVTLYFLLENIALTYTSASNVGVIISVAPFFTGLFAWWFLKTEKPKLSFYLGFVIAMLGIGFISFNGSRVLQLNPLGDILTVVACLVWGGYSVLIRKISIWGYNTVQTTRRTFFYGIVFMVPALFFMGFSPNLKQIVQPINLFNFLFLGLGASALCFVTWNFAVKILGAIKTSVYIYMGPVITVAASVLLLGEKVTWGTGVGVLLTLAGLFISEIKLPEKRKKAEPPIGVEADIEPV